MAGNRYITGGTSGVWTAATTGAFKWNDYETLGLPVFDDDVYANNKTVYINSNINVKSLNTLSAAGIAAGGGFSISAGTPSITITSTTINAGTSSCLSNNMTSNILYIIGNFSGATSGGFHSFINNSSGTVYITGNTIGNSGNGVYNLSTGTIYFSGNSVTSIGTNSGLRNDNIGIIYAIADTISGGTSGVGISNNGAGNVFITGNTRGGPNGSGVNNNSTGNVFIVGTAIGGSGAYGVNNGSTGNIFFSGNVSGGTVINFPGINSATAGIINVTGNCYSSSVSAAIQNTSQSGLLNVVGNVYNLSGISAIYSYNLKISPTAPQSFTMQDNTVTSASTIFSTSAYTNTLPLPQDVRSGYTYGFLSGLTGTCVIPPSQSVSVGVKVDNGSGVTTSGTSINRIIEAGAMYASFGVSGY
jgi:hypothetical protein